MRALPEVEPIRHGVLTTADLRAAGWGRSAVAHALRSSRLVALARGVYAPADLLVAPGPDGRRQALCTRSVAAVLAVDGAIASHRSAAALAGLPLWTATDRPCVTVRPRKTGDAVVAHLHRATLSAGDVTPREVPRTTVARTIVDTAREHGVEDAVVIADAALGRRMTDGPRLERALRQCEGWPGFADARRVLPLVDARAESPLESVSRLRLVGAGLPAPTLQAELVVRSSRIFVGRVDLYWDEFGVAGEVDGRVKYDHPEALWKEKRRQEGVEQTGVIVIRWGRQDLNDLPALVDRLTRAFLRGARRPRAERNWAVLPSFAPLEHADRTG